MKTSKLSLFLGLMLTAGVSQALEVHEWGTFTSLVNEKGELMSGMHHEEEGLPGFVYGLRAEGPELQNSPLQLGLEKCGGAHPGRPTKCAFSTDKDFVPFNEFNTRVTQKMETPVIYFYGNKGESAHVEVDFPDGMISQWFPKASTLNLHLQEFRKGFMTWDVTLLGANETANFPKTNGNSIWNPARNTNANVVKVDGEEERFIFYRGLADFSVPLKVLLRDLPGGELEVTLTNSSTEDVPALFYIQSGKVEGVKNYLTLPALKAGETKVFTTKSVRTTGDVRVPLQEALVAAGLFADEAAAMLGTWDKSYFHTEGDRLLYILPREWTEKILPMRVKPEPTKLSRVLVGRIELFSKNDQANFKTGQTFDHLREAKLNALKK